MDEQLLNIGIKIKGLQSATFSGRINDVPKSIRRRNYKAELEYLEAITYLGDLIIQARKKQDSVKLQKMAKCLQEVIFYVNQLEMERNNLYIDNTLETEND